MSKCLVLDMAQRADPIIDELKQSGVTTVFRYYASGFQPSLPEKRLTREECDALLAAGLGVGVVFQFNNNMLSSMTKARGRDDAEFSLEAAGDIIAQPPGSAIYFGIDGDWHTASEQKKVKDYFEGVNEVFSPAGMPYRIGVYGSGLTCTKLRDAGLATLFWLPLSTGWSGTRDFYNSGGWHFYQNFHGLRIGGRFTDTNVVNPAISDIGTFDQGGAVSDIGQPAGVPGERRFVRTAGLKLRSGPGTSHPVVGSLRKRQNIRILEEVGDWSRVDIDEDGDADGFCSSSHLVPFDTMP
jgi:hypothetical protein